MSVKQQLITVAGVLFVAALFNAVVIYWRIGQMANDAHVVNYAGVVRGGTQRLVKRELDDQPSDELLAQLDVDIDGLLNGSTDLNLPSATDAEFVSAMRDVRDEFDELSDLIRLCRTDESVKPDLYAGSEDLFSTTDRAVAAAETFSRGKVSATRVIHLVLSLVNILIVVVIAWLTRRITLTLNDTISTLATTSDQIAATADMQERVATEQATAMNETTTTIEQIGETSRMAASQSQSTADEARQSMKMAHEGSETVQQTLDSMAELKKNVSHLAQEILSLSERVDQIDEVSHFVGDLANQTNMLALNASVEAAHAGEHGKGFAVVAAEIRKLADQSTRSVSRIGTLVTDIQQATNSAVMATEEGTKVVDHGMTLASQTADVFNRLGDSIDRASESVQQISLNTREQAAGINQIVEAIESLNSGARENVNGLRQTNEGLQTINLAVHGMQAMVGVADANRR